MKKGELVIDEMRVKLSTRFMRGVVSRLITRSIYKKYGYKVKVQLEDLDIKVINGEATINLNTEIILNNEEFMKIIKKIDSE